MGGSRDVEQGAWATGNRQIICSLDLNERCGKQWQGVGVEQAFLIERTSTILKTGEIRH